MLFTIILFFIAIVVVFGMLYYRAWELRTSRKSIPDGNTTLNIAPDLSFRHVEKNVLYFTKHVLQNILLFVIKWWFIMVANIKRWAMPKINSYFGKKEVESEEQPKRLSFWRRAILESKAKIRKMKEKVKKEQEEKEQEYKDIEGTI